MFVKRALVWTAFAVAVGLVGVGSAKGDCKPADPVGYFEGTATSKQAGKLEVSLNLRCVDGRYSGELITPVGTYSVEEGNSESGRLRLRLGAGADGDRVDIEAHLDTGVLRGTFVAGDDTGPVELRCTGEARLPGSLTPTLAMSKQQWHEDLKFYATELPKRHINAFHYTSRERFDAEVTTLDHRIDQLDGDEVFVGLVRIAALIGDGHTHFESPDDVANFPIEVRRFGDDYRIVAVSAAANENRALGARIVRIEGTPIARVRELLLSLTPQDENHNLGLARIEQTMTEGLYLHGLGIIRDRNTVHYTLTDETGKEFTIEVHGAAMAESMNMQWVQPFREQPLYRQNSGNPFWCQYLPDSRTAYCNFRGYDKIEKTAGALMELVKVNHADKLVVDLRQNGGGDYTQGQKFVIEPIRNLSTINKKGHLFVLIGPYTFSAGMCNAAQFRSTTAAILVGEPIGEKPNSFQEAREIHLPNSHLLARYSTEKYDFVKNGENVIRPDKEIDRNWNSYQAGRDPVLEWVLAYKASQN
jgi:hypothetical protein